LLYENYVGSIFLLKARAEREYEQNVVSYLQSSRRLRNNLITQVSDEEVDKITHANLFGFKHRPDVTIGNDGTAIEIKLITSGGGIRDIIGQGFVYRMSYRFVILVIVDNTEDRNIVDLCSKKNSHEYAFLNYLAEEHNIFSIVGPKSHSFNLSFFPHIETDKTGDEEEEKELSEDSVPVEKLEENKPTQQ
jgi:hypothetical protein